MSLPPRPKQSRALSTVTSAIDATIELIEERGEDRVRIQDVTARSRVTNGSLMHHFGSREGLIAAALASRYDRSVIERVRLFGDLGGDRDALVAGLSQLLLGASLPARIEARRARLRALSYARHRPELREALVGSFRTAEEELSERLISGQDAGLVVDGLSGRALAVFAETYAVGILVDQTLVVPLRTADWEALFLVVLGAIIPPGVLDRLRGDRNVPATSAAVPDGGSVPAPPVPLPSLNLGADERRVVDHAVGQLRAAGPDSLRVVSICEATGVSRGWFSRHIGDREELIALARIEVLLRFSSVETAVYEAAFESAASGAELRAALADIAGRTKAADFLDAAWDRLELIVTAGVGEHPVDEASEVVRISLERIARAIAGAQARGVVRGGLDPRVIARFLWAYPVAFLLGDLVGSDGDDLRVLADHTNATLCTTARAEQTSS
jgi:AcrR family transcriptional regulator